MNLRRLPRFNVLSLSSTLRGATALAVAGALSTAGALGAACGGSNSQIGVGGNGSSGRQLWRFERIELRGLQRVELRKLQRFELRKLQRLELLSRLLGRRRRRNL